MNVNLLSVDLLSGEVVRAGPAAPWILTFALPIGAYFALRRYRQWRSTIGATSVDLPVSV